MGTLPKPIDLWPGEALVVGGPLDGQIHACRGRSLVYIKPNQDFRPWQWEYDEKSPVGIGIEYVECRLERYFWYEYFEFLWFHVPIGMFIRTVAIDPSERENFERAKVYGTQG